VAPPNERQRQRPIQRIHQPAGASLGATALQGDGVARLMLSIRRGKSWKRGVLRRIL
jgi:hypothetical protein